MEEARLRVQSHAFQRRAAVVDQERVKEAQERIHVIERRPPRPFLEEEGILVLQNQRVEGSKVLSCGVTFNASQPLQSLRLFQRANRPYQSVGRRSRRRTVQSRSE